MATSNVQFNGVTGSVETLPLGVLCQLSNLNDAGVSAWLYELLDIPEGSATALSNPAIANPTFTPDHYGSYRVRLTVNGTTSDIQIGTVLTINLPVGVPAYQELHEFGAKGWKPRVNEILKQGNIGTGYGDVAVVSNETGGVLSIGETVYMVDRADAYAGSANHMAVLYANNTIASGIRVGIVLGDLNGLDSIADGSFCYVQFRGIANGCTVTGFAVMGEQVGLNAINGDIQTVTTGGVHPFGYAYTADTVLVDQDNIVGAAGPYIAETVAQIKDAFDNQEPWIVVKTGTYNMATYDLITVSGQHVTWQDVELSNCTLKSKCNDDGNWYPSYATSTCLWNAGTSKFDRTGGNNWVGDNTWWIFVRDAWYRITAFDTNAIIDPVEEPRALSGITVAQRYVLCVPDEGIHWEGTLKLDAVTADLPVIQFDGLANCNFENCEIVIAPDFDISTDIDQVVIFRGCAKTTFPQLDIEHVSFTHVSADNRAPIVLQNIIQCSAYNWHVTNTSRTDAGAGDLYGVWMDYCQDLRLNDVFISGLYRVGAAQDAMGFYPDNCNNCDIMTNMRSIAATGNAYGAYIDTCEDLRVTGTVTKLAGAVTFDWDETGSTGTAVSLVWS